jgi:hypothetical protein
MGRVESDSAVDAMLTLFRIAGSKWDPQPGEKPGKLVPFDGMYLTTSTRTPLPTIPILGTLIPFVIIYLPHQHLPPSDSHKFNP